MESKKQIESKGITAVANNDTSKYKKIDEFFKPAKNEEEKVNVKIVVKGPSKAAMEQSKKRKKKMSYDSDESESDEWQ